MSSEPREHQPHHPPHKTFGRYLKTMRQKLQESLGETSASVEIEVEQLDRFERGAELPSEDILMLLISHFGLQDDEAVELWEMAGYDGETGYNAAQRAGRAEDGFDGQRHAAPIMLLALDNRVLYSNGVDVLADDSGVVMNFMQSTDPSGQRFAVSRIGMSFEQAQQLVEVVQRALLHRKYRGGPKQLPPPSSPSSD